MSFFSKTKDFLLIMDVQRLAKSLLNLYRASVLSLIDGERERWQSALVNSITLSDMDLNPYEREAFIQIVEEDSFWGTEKEHSPTHIVLYIIFRKFNNEAVGGITDSAKGNIIMKGVSIALDAFKKKNPSIKI